MRPFALALGAVLAGACAGPVQGPDVTAVSQTTMRRLVVGRSFHPAVVVVLDRSASMGAPLDAADPACPPGCGAFTPCPAGCRTRLDEARDGLAQFIDHDSLDQRLGLMAFGADDACGAPITPLVTPLPIEREDDRHALARNGEAMKRQLGLLTTSGGAPVAAALRLAASLPSMNDQSSSHLILLVTAGAPACDGRPCSTGCLDVDDAAAAIRESRAKRIETVVVGVGRDAVLGARGQALNTLATAAGVRSFCTTSADCGEANACLPDRTCARTFLLPNELVDAFRPIWNLLSDPCEFPLYEQPQRPDYVSVQFNGTTVAPGPQTWRLEAGAVRVSGSSCTQMRDSTPDRPFELTVRVLEVL